MKSLIRFFAFLMIFPYLCGFAPYDPDDPELSVSFAAGGGSYAEVSRDCSGKVLSVKDHPYQEVAGGIRYRVSDVVMGVTGGNTSGFRDGMHQVSFQDGGMQVQESKDLIYAAPSFGFTTEYIGIEFGYLFSLNGRTVQIKSGGSDRTGMPTGLLRFGKSSRTHFVAGVGRNFPLFSGGGLIDAGISVPIGAQGSRMFYGLGGIPYDGIVFSAKGDFQLSDKIALTPTFHAKGGDAFEFGGSFGIRMTF